MNKTSDTQSGGRGWFKKLFWLVVLAGCGLGLVAAGVRWHGPLGRLVGLAGRQERGPTTRPAPADQQVWYTCGMHPSVLQKQPGNCPICGMKLTPLRAGAAGVAPSGPKQRKILYWRAPMDPNYISDKPGKSPMGMELVPVYAEPGEEISAAAIRIDPVTVQNMGIRTVRLKRDRLVKVIRTVGRLDYDERKVGDVTTRFDGWIEKLYVDYLGMEVHQGDPLFEIYSREVYETADTYLKSLASGILAADTRRRLELLGVPGREIERLESQRQLRRTILVRSPFSGIVVEKMVQAGSYVKSGMRLYRIADLSTIWVYVDIYEYQLPWVRLGQEATMTLPYIPGRTFRGKVLYIYPYLTRAARVVKVRLEFDNPKQELKPGMYANVRLEAVVKDDALLIPREAYIDSGLRKVAFVDLGGGRFEPRQIRTGMESDGLVEVLDGLYEGEAVVSSGQFLLDAESKLREAVAKMTRLGAAATSSPSPSQRSGHAKPTGQEHASPTTQPAEASAGVAYTCPDHINVFSSAPGQCPRCGRQLEPFKLIYTCRRMEHAAVLSSSKGRCPRCGQELVPMRGPWLSDAMAWANTPPTTQAAARAAYHCPVHPLVHSELPGRCTICVRPLERGPAATQPAATQPAAPRQYVCPMHPQVRRAGPG
ncbi:MAG: efflux RND transporter periplasmic adaptor subunit, partial [Phycisphaerae bacterium]